MAIRQPPNPAIQVLDRGEEVKVVVVVVTEAKMVVLEVAKERVANPVEQVAMLRVVGVLELHPLLRRQQPIRPLRSRR